MTMTDGLFIFFAALTVIPAFLCVALSKNIIRAAFLLMLTFWGVAGLYGLLGADFLLATQLIVYVGGILVLILYGVMLSRRVTMSELPVGAFSIFAGAGGCIALGIFLYKVILETPWNATASPAAGSAVRPIGELFLGKFLLPFEFISLLLLAALIGAVILARKEFDEVAEEIV
jgi:NADH-quinone oxidoreductase subunit J